MSAKLHNKKRNLGLLYEFLVRYASRELIEGREERSATVLMVLKKHFAPGAPLHKEFRLFNSLMKVEISSPAVASSILEASRSAVRDYDVAEVEKAKTRLINEVNRALDDDAIWTMFVPHYKVYATIGTLINEWRSPSGKADIEKLAQYEEKLVDWLMQKKEQNNSFNELKESDKSPAPLDALTMKIALKKFNEKYSDSNLLPEQRDILRSWVLAKDEAGIAAVRSSLEKLRSSLSSALEKTMNEDKSCQSFSDELGEARGALLSESLESIDDEKVKRFMLYSRLHAELANRSEGVVR